MHDMDTATTAQQVGANVRAEAARRGVSGSALAREIGLSQSAMSRRLHGEYPFDVEHLAKIAAALNCPLSALLPESTVGAA